MTQMNVYASPYAIAHPNAYELIQTSWRDAKATEVELVLVDAADQVIEEDGCNCDLDYRCNNPKCVMDGEREERQMAAEWAHHRLTHPETYKDDLIGAGRAHLLAYGIKD